MKHLYFIRHGESEMNVAKLWAGGLTDSPLTAKGKTQAKAAGKAARDAGLVFDVIVSSPQQRAHHTAQSMAEHTEYPLYKIELRSELRERDFGALEGKDLHADFNIPLGNYITDPFAIDHIDDMEKITDLQFRANKVLEELRKRPEETILIVSHGAFGRALKRAIANAPLTEHVEPFDNAKLTKLI